MTISNKSIDDKILDNFYKQSADKIIQHLETIREERKKNSRRWIWELIQNAKDVKNLFDKVSILITVQEDQLSFSHNADPFSENNLISLVQQVSSKDSENADEEVTGKFGTGFISTHLLSDLIEVTGVLRRDSGNHQRFKISLDRQAEKSEDLSILIKKTIDTIRKLDKDPAFTPANDYEKDRKEEDFDTTFAYPLKGKPSHDAATAGLQELLNNLPLSLVFLKNIKIVEINNLPIGVVHKYTCQEEKSIDGIVFYAVTKQTTEEENVILHFLKLSSPNSELDLVIPVNNLTDLAISVHDGKTPFLYRDFPLIGTEQFYFPFYLNGRTFYTSVERDGILINGDEKKPSHNRELLTIARDTAIQFTKFLLDSKAKNLFVSANTRLPLIAEMSKETKEWFMAYQRLWRSELVSLQLVETTKENISIRELKMPSSQYGSTPQDHEKMYGFISDIYGEEIVPRIDIRENWLYVFAPKEEYETWVVKPICDEQAVLSTIQAAGTLDNLSFKKEYLVTEKQKLDWLNQFFQYLEEKKQLAQLDAFSGTPNENGHFRKNSPLFWEPKTDPIADELLKALETLGKPWRDTMIKRGIEISDSLKRPRGLVDASRQINEIVSVEKKEKNVVVSDFLDQPNALQVIIEIMSLITENVDKNSFRYLLFKACRDLLGFQLDFRLIGHLGNFNFDRPTFLLVRILHQSIEKCKDLEGLSHQLKRTSDETLIWLDRYLRTLEESKGSSYLLAYGNIVPNREGRLCAYEDLYNFGTAEQPLDNDLLRILRELDPKQDWRPKLVADGISLKLKKTLSLEDLTGLIKLFVKDIYSQDVLQPYRDQLLDLINWCNDDRHAEVKRKHMDSFDNMKDTIFYALTIKDSVYNKQIMELMKKPEEIPILMAIASSGIPAAKIKALIDSLKDSADVDKVVDYVEDLKKKRDDFNFKQRLGKRMEDYFQEALQVTHIDADVKYVGSGSRDFIITGRQTKKQFYIELKSHAKINTLEPISLAISQARLAVRESKRFALCVVERPQDPISDVGRYMRENLKYLGGLAKDFGTVVANADQLDGIINDHSAISLELEDTTYHVKVARGYIQAKARSFDDLITAIRQEIA